MMKATIVLVLAVFMFTGCDRKFSVVVTNSSVNDVVFNYDDIIVKTNTVSINSTLRVMLDKKCQKITLGKDTYFIYTDDLPEEFWLVGKTPDVTLYSLVILDDKVMVKKGGIETMGISYKKQCKKA